MYTYRIAKENLVLAGLWYGTVKPDMSLFMKPLTEALKRLHDEGKMHELTMLIVCHNIC